MPFSDFSHVPAEGESIYGKGRSGRKPGPDYKIDHDTGCWNWLKFKMAWGYPSGRAHRRYWELANGRKLSSKEHLHHKCVNPSCVNPDHLEPVDQVTHMIEHRLHTRGLTIQDIIDIREAGKDPTVTAQQLSDKYGFTPNNIWYIWTARIWGHLGGPVKPAGQTCRHCGGDIDPAGRRHRVFCSKRCQQASNRAKPEQKERAAQRQRRRRDAAKRAA